MARLWHTAEPLKRVCGQADQRNRARLNAAHSVLSDSDAKSAYDKHRQDSKTQLKSLFSLFTNLAQPTKQEICEHDNPVSGLGVRPRLTR
jgi:DnaJ-class molecular chaperone